MLFLALVIVQNWNQFFHLGEKEFLGGVYRDAFGSINLRKNWKNEWNNPLRKKYVVFYKE